ncbi:hypothetical protein AVEN_85078-1 [Araneus ventricosus]|uniref:Uncharacterized protein n=1 Tax=Araneus ventricosus TaxID=182803 RepID=A0A4Y2HWX4_ARAVE|nr:hypothetical protein AVEN_85078-1 [Araneus ventricosus]
MHNITTIIWLILGEADKPDVSETEHASPWSEEYVCVLPVDSLETINSPRQLLQSIVLKLLTENAPIDSNAREKTIDSFEKADQSTVPKTRHHQLGFDSIDSPSMFKEY